MNPHLESIPGRILDLAVGALAQANHHAVFFDPGNEHWDFISILNTAHAGELFMKAAIAREHPLLIFKDVFGLDDQNSEHMDIQKLIARGRTHDFERLPQVLWATTGVRIPDMECFTKLRTARNAIQHFCAPPELDLRQLSIEFIYKIIDPLIASQFGLFAIEFHEDHSAGYDYVVEHIVRRELKFSLPDDFNITEVDLSECAAEASDGYRDWLRSALSRLGKADLLT